MHPTRQTEETHFETRMERSKRTWRPIEDFDSIKIKCQEERNVLSLPKLARLEKVEIHQKEIRVLHNSGLYNNWQKKQYDARIPMGICSVLTRQDFL